MPKREKERDERGEEKKSNKCGGIEEREINPSFFLVFLLVFFFLYLFGP